MNRRLTKLIMLSPLILIGLALFVALGGQIVLWLWNGLLPSLFGWPRLTFWQALGLLALCRILFGGLGLHPSPGAGARRRMAERWAAMTPEERERFRKGMWGRFGFAPPAGESGGKVE